MQPAPPLLGSHDSADAQLLHTAPFSSSSSSAPAPADFAALGLSAWLVASVSQMGIHRPTSIQSACIPAVLSGRDVVGCAETGSGKTAAFALPILERLGKEPWGIAALVLTPSRELAFQIGEQFTAFGAPLHTRVVVVTGGVDLVTQGSAVAAVPHVVVATPGRLAHFLSSGATPPDLSRLGFLVLDEVDRLSDDTFAQDLGVILQRAAPSYPQCQTLLFSATLGVGLPKISQLRVSPKAFHFDAGSGGGAGSARSILLPATLRQEYLFKPADVKNAYLIHLLLRLGPLNLQIAAGSGAGGGGGSGARAPAAASKASKASRSVTGKDASAAGALLAGVGGEVEEDVVRARSILIFVSTCASAACVSELLKEFGIPCTALHSVMPQSARLGSLAKFKSELVRVLVATDVASRGLDLPAVDLVINYDVPRKAEDYVHRVGRTARAGRGGRAVTLVTQFETDLFVAIEKGALGGAKLPAIAEFLIAEKEVLARLSKVAVALEMAKTRLVEIGVAGALDSAKQRKAEGRESRRRLKEAAEGEGGSS